MVNYSIGVSAVHMKSITSCIPSRSGRELFYHKLLKESRPQTCAELQTPKYDFLLGNQLTVGFWGPADISTIGHPTARFVTSRRVIPLLRAQHYMSTTQLN